MNDQSLDARHIAREQESRITAAATIGLNAAKALLNCQASMLRLWADNVELAAHNYEKWIEALGASVEQQSRQHAA